ncbi:MAG: DUF3108 domain-containing protein [Bacteroidia bacterium]
MKKVLKITVFAVIALVFGAFTIPQKVHVKSFDLGERLNYKVKYNLYINVPVAELELKVSHKLREFNGHECLQFSATGKTYKFYDNFFPVRDYFNALVDPETFKPRVFTRDVSEGDYSKKDYTLFFPETQKVKTKKGNEYDVPHDTWDILSVWYLARNFDYDQMNKGDSVKMHTFIDNETYPIGLQYAGTEVLNTDFGKVKCHIIKPLLIAGEIFKSESDMTLWVSADQNKIPIVIESGISVGKVRAEINEYSGLKYDFESLIEN